MTLTTTRSVGIDGWVHKPFVCDPDTLAGHPACHGFEFTVICTLDGAHGGPQRYHGVPLAPLIERAAPAFEQRTDFKRVIVVAEGIDGYRAVFSWAEIFNTDVGGGVVLAWEDEHPESPFALVSRHDHATGPRFVRGLRTVSVVKLW
ncbi:MAG TPA: hypothetical protein PKA20_19290 [Burkholderiaceae bacterium]|nr:hypothetical protein [Burkholderiaceae bacterium]